MQSPPSKNTKTILTLFPYRGKGGATSVSRRLHEEFSLMGYTTRYLTICSPESSLEDHKDYEDNEDHDTLGFDHPRNLFDKTYQLGARTMSLIRYCLKHKVTHIVSHQEEANCIAILANIYLRIHVYCVVHSNFTTYISFIERFIYKLLYQKSNIIPVSHGLSDMMHKEGFTSTLSLPISNRNRLPVVSEYEIKNRFSTNTSPKTRALHIGNFEPVKQQSHLISCVSQLSGRSLDLIGTGKDEEKLQTLINENENKQKMGKIKILGYKKNISELMKSYDVFLFSSEVEGFGLVIIEAMSQGLPIISYNTPYGPSEILTGKHIEKVDGYIQVECGYIVECNNIDVLIQACKSFQSLTTEKRISMGKQARDRSLLFTKSTILQQRKCLLNEK